MTSLNEFFSSCSVADLNTCDREEIHRSGAIQAVGALILVSTDNYRILAATQSAARLFDKDLQDMLGKPLQEHAAELAHELQAHSNIIPAVHTIADTSYTDKDDNSFDTLIYLDQDRYLIEFLPAGDITAPYLRQALRLVSRNVDRIQRSETIEDAYQLTCDAVRELTGFARVKLYRFRSDWSGIVEAESRADHMVSYLGLNFPDTDIPQQARALFGLLPYRAIATVNDENELVFQDPELGDLPLDLTYSLLRSASTMHTAYLRNMGVASTFSVGITSQDKLWGMIACHNDGPMIMPFDCWTLARDLCDALRIRIDIERERQTTRQLIELREIESKLSASMRKNGNVDKVMSEFAPQLQSFLRADGFVFRYGEQSHTSGKTPPPEFIDDFIAWVDNKSDAFGQYQTTALHKEWPAARDHMDTCCGAIIQPVMMHRVCHMIWFRAPLADGISWAGEPQDKSAGSGETASLLPRTSFATWISQNNDTSEEWSPAELASAREILKEVLDIIAALFVLSEEVDTLKSLTTAAVHDIGGPLRGIDYALEILRELGITSEDAALSLEIASQSSKRLGDLTKSMLDFVWLKDEKVTFETIDLNSVANEARMMMDYDAKRVGATITIAQLPAVKCNRDLLTRVFLNLFGNAIKYRAPSRPLDVSVMAKATFDQSVEIHVSDNGPGISKAAAERVFAPLTRLHAHDEVAGTGLGLSICRRIIDLHNGKISFDTDVALGATCVIRLPAAA